MKKKLRIVWLCMFCLAIAVSTQAAQVNWDVGPQGATGSYSIPFGSNGGQFWYLTSPVYSNTQLGGNQNSFNLNTPATDTTTETFEANPGQIEFYAMGGGGTHADGVVNQAVAQITKTDMDSNHYITAGTQTIQSQVARSFSADTGARVTVSADIVGMMDWINSNWNWSDGSPGSITGPVDPSLPYAGYRITANVSFLPMSISGGSVSADIPDPIDLDAQNLSGSTSFLADADPDIFYRLFAGITLDTRVQNLLPLAGYGPLGPLPDVGSIGTQGDPLLMTTTVSQSPVPIPGSIILLLSGLAGLTTLRHRRK